MNISKLLEQSDRRVGKTLFVAVDGHGGSGKSAFAKWLGHNLHAEIIKTDDFASWDDPSDWWPKVIEKVFKPISEGEKYLNYDRSKWWENHHPESVIKKPVTDLMILEGVGSSRKEFREYIRLHIFVDTPEDVCIKRGVEKDLITGKTREELLEIWKKWIDHENEYIQRDHPKEYADIVFNGTKPFVDQIQF